MTTRPLICEVYAGCRVLKLASLGPFQLSLKIKALKTEINAAILLYLAMVGWKSYIKTHAYVSRMEPVDTSVFQDILLIYLTRLLSSLGLNMLLKVLINNE